MPDAIRVLHVDDDPDFADLVATFLEQEDDQLRVDSAPSANVGLNRLTERSIECIVSDYEMPGMNGLEFLETVRESRSDLPFILYTGKGSESIASEAISTGVTDYLQKGAGPDTYALLANRIRNAVENYQNERALRETQARFQILVQESTDAIFIVGQEGTIEFVTPVAEELIGQPPEELIGTTGFEYVHTEDREKVQNEFERLIESPEERASVHFRFTHEDGTSVEVEARGRNLLDHQLIQGIVVYVRPDPILS